MSRVTSRGLWLLRQCERYPRQRGAFFPVSNHHRHESNRKHPFSASTECRAATSKAAAKEPTASHRDYRVERARQEALREGHFPEDVGLIENTFIMPHGKKLPLWTSNFRQRLRLERKRLLTRLTEYPSILMYRVGWFTKPRPRLRLRRIPEVAEDLHRSMYEHFATGELDQLKTTLVPGFLSKLRTRLMRRTSGTQLRWRLHQHKTPPQVSSFKVALMPKVKGAPRRESNGYVQAVVRIHSLQSLQHIRLMPVREAGKEMAFKEVVVDASGRELPQLGDSEEAASAQAKEVVEYVVLQKAIRKNKEGPWKLWGTTEETSVQSLERRQKKPDTASPVAA